MLTTSRMTRSRYESNFEDFKEMSVQFGYVTLFAVSFPLAALFAWLNNVSEMRLDAYQVCRMHRRAEWRNQEDIGSWAKVFTALSVVNVLTNACLIAFVGSQLADAIAEDGVPKETFSDRLKMWKMWAVLVIIEHGIFVVKFALVFVQPSEPEWLGDAREALDFHDKNRSSD
jgi:hypothetical protein|eukprot:COSAG01_NODE_15338_length_1348_cov_0.776621_1_plen_172_part_00